MTRFRTPLARRLLVVFSLIVILTTASCYSDDPDESGVSGTGLIIRGSVSESAFAINDFVEVKSSDGVTTMLPIDTATGQFGATSLSGAGPWVLRVQLASSRSVYSIAYGDGVHNINGFTDLALRNWFVQRSFDIDVEFQASGAFGELPDVSVQENSLSNVFELVEPVLSSYGVTGNEVASSDYVVGPQGEGPGVVGIDAFLKRNAVLLENGSVSFVITDPGTDTQSVTQSSLSLGNNLNDNLSVAPAAPESVRALGSAVDEIIVVWEPSSDDVAVTLYQVIRDGNPIATTPYPVFIDSGLAAQSYTYEIVAIDVGGNESATSLAVVASPLQNNDSTAPPAPTVLIALDVSSSRIELIWGQDNIQDVARFNLYRGINGQPLDDVLLQLTSTIAVDTSVVANQSYCYQVEAVDASGNMSGRSDILCVTATDTDGPNGVVDPVAEWIVPDVDALACTQILSSAQVQPGVTVVNPGCYLVQETLTVGPGATLRVSAGVVLKFAEAAKLAVSSNGTLTINGTTASPAVLTGQISVPGFWGGVEFQNSTSVGNLLRGAVIQYAGSADSLAAVAVVDGRSRFRIEDTLVRFNRVAFVFGFDNIVIDEFQGNRITENDSLGQVKLDLLASLAGNSEFAGNTVDVLDVPLNRYTDRSITIPSLGIPLAWNGVVIERGALTIESGATLEMVPTSSIRVDGVVSAVGTQDRPIVIRGRSTTTQPQWDGLELSGRGDKNFNHIAIINGGADSISSGAIDLRCTVAEAASFSIDNAVVSDSASWGIYIDAPGCGVDIGNNMSYLNNALGDVRLP